MASTPEEQAAAMAERLRELTGRSLAEWKVMAAGSGRTKHGEIVGWLKSEHALTHGYANFVAHATLASDAGSMLAAGDDLVAAMFVGDKAALRPIFDRIVDEVRRFGSDVTEAPKKGYLSLRRSTQFATLHPSTRSRLDVGIKLKGVPPAGRLEAAGSWNGMVSHRVRLSSVDDANAELVAWLKQAYENA